MTPRRASGGVAVVCAAVALGCTKPVPPAWITPESPSAGPTSFYPAEVEYALGELVSGQACIDEELLAQLPTDGSGLAHPAVREAARYDALSRAPDADALLAERSVVSWKDGKECVELTGRAYRVTAMRSVAPSAAPSTSAGLAGPGLAGLGAKLPAPGGTTATKGVPSRGFVTIGTVADAFGVTAGWVKQFGAIGLELGAIANTEGDVLAPTLGVLFGVPYSRGYTYAGVRVGYTLTEASPIIDATAGNDLMFGRVGLRSEAGTTVHLDNGLSFRASIGPTFRF